MYLNEIDKTTFPPSIISYIYAWKSFIARILQQCHPILSTPLEPALEKSHSNQEAFNNSIKTLLSLNYAESNELETARVRIGS